MVNIDDLLREALACFIRSGQIDSSLSDISPLNKLSETDFVAVLAEIDYRLADNICRIPIKLWLGASTVGDWKQIILKHLRTGDT